MDASAADRSSGGWYRRYVTRVAVTDALIVVTAVSLAYWIRLDQVGGATVSGELAPSYLALSVGLMAAWLAVLDLGHTRDRRLVGHGPAEYARVFSVSVRLFAGLAIASYLLRMEVSRGYVAIAAPLGILLLLAARFGWRQWLHRERLAGGSRSAMLVVGTPARAQQFIEVVHASPRSGYQVCGVCTPAPADADATVAGVPVLGTFDDAAAAAQQVAARVVAVTGSDAITADAVRRLGWDLEGKGIDLAVAPALTDVAGPRVLMQPVSGLPLIYVDEPRFTGAKYAVKSVADWLGALVLLALLSPVLVVTAVLVKATSPGPVFYAQTRAGLHGRPFRMLKFRSMSDHAHEQLAEVLAAEGVTGVVPFYKPRNDPRVTPVGRVLRRYSVDELPQLFNVLRGEMSLVGPRPQIDQEVALYDRRANRRLLVRPGMTGLWQVSGRSGLTPDQSVRLDVYYVENWTLFGDFLILARTAKAMVAAEGAI